MWGINPTIPPPWSHIPISDFFWKVLLHFLTFRGDNKVSKDLEPFSFQLSFESRWKKFLLLSNIILSIIYRVRHGKVVFQTLDFWQTKVVRLIFIMDFLFSKINNSFETSKFSRFSHFREKVSWFQLFVDIFQKRFF